MVIDRLTRTVLAVVVLTAACAGADELDESADVGVLRPLIERGVRLTQSRWHPLPAPSMHDGWSAAEQRAAVTKIAGRYGWQSFVRDTAVAPFALELAYIRDAAGNRIGHAVDLWFVGRGTLANLESERLAVGLFAEGEGNEEGGGFRVRVLEEAELTRSGIDPPDFGRERYVFAEFPLLNRVQVRGVGHARRAVSDESLVVAWELDPRFDDADENMTNSWQPIEADTLGNRSLGTARRYQGYGGYLKVTRLLEPEGALLIEAHVAFHEPDAWFRGGNALRSKMPLAVQENVRKFRLQLSRIGS